MGKLIIDGIEVEPDPSRTVLDVANELGIHIPTLCYHPSLPYYGACRVCLIEVIWKGDSSLKTACTFPAWEGEVRTNSEKVRKARKVILELMLAEAPDSPEIKELAREYGIEKTRFKVREERKGNKCIQCALCVRFCRDVLGIGAIGFKNRGYARELTTPFEIYSDVCTTCGACEFLCPTNAIDLSKISPRKPIPLLSEFEVGLKQRSCISIPFPQAVPNKPVLDRDHCMHFLKDACGVCSTVCAPQAINYDQEEETLKKKVGAIIVATGYDQFDPSLKPELGYKDYERVITGLEFERLVSPSGPTGGKILICGEEPKKVVLIHCVGSRDQTVGNEYCSRVCCMYLAKHAHLIKDKIPKAEVTCFYMDVRAFGKGYEEFYDRVRNEGILYRRGSVSEIFKRKGKLIVKGEDTLLGEPVEEEADLVVLGTGIVPRFDVEKMGRILKIVQSQDKFFLEAHPKLRPVDTFSEGIYLAGCCQGPKDIPDTVAQAKAAASSAVSILSKKLLTVAPIVAVVNENICAGCRSCEEVCEFSAHEFNEKDRVMTINTVLCKGCGNCVTNCPSSAIRLNSYTDTQVLAQIGSILEKA
ncbi:4Fe-4S dicluster domain-containing protein [bacterium]|nr:4Fe-4S dicluster domain-containing protein [bacterium]